MFAHNYMSCVLTMLHTSVLRLRRFSCLDSFSEECLADNQWWHWIGLRLVSNCECATHCTCHDAWQWVDGSDTSAYAAWNHSYPLQDHDCAVTSCPDDNCWMSASCDSTAQVFCKTGIAPSGSCNRSPAKLTFL